MKALAILILLIPCVVMAETFTMPLSTVDTNPATAASLLSRPEIAEYAERVQRIGNVFIIEWNQYDTEAVSVEYKVLKPLGVNPPKSFAVDGSDESVDKEEITATRRIAGTIFKISDGRLPIEETEAVITEIINGAVTDLENIPHNAATDIALNYDYELGKQLILYLHENHYEGASWAVDTFADYIQENSTAEDAIKFIEFLKSLKSGATNKKQQEDIEKDYDTAIKRMQPPD